MRCTLRKLILFLLFAIFSSIAFSGTIDPNTPDSKYLDYAKKFTYIGRVCGKTNNGMIYCGSAVAIRPRVILTAAHVIKDTKSCFLSINSKEICVPKVVYHSSFDDNKFGHGDIAIGFTENDIGLDFYPELYTNKDEINKICCISGFGISGTFLTGATIGDAKQRAGSNKIDYIDRQLLMCSATRGRGRTSLEFLIASGDSGGGLFIDGKLAGINSCVISDGKGSKLQSTYETESGHTRVSDFVEWINNTIGSEQDEK
jgi:hypothetical protein